MRFLRAVPVLCLPLALAARPALGQDVAECPVDLFQPAQLAQAGLTIGRAAQATDSASATKLLRDAMKYLQDEKKLAGNPVGAAFLRAQIYLLWLHQDGVPDTLTYAQLNMKGEKTTLVDLVEAADSGLKAVEALAPICAEATANWRGSKPWTDRINKAYTFLSADDLDPATYWAKRSALLNPTSPFVHNIFAQLANKRGDVPTMLTHLRLAISESLKDTSLAQTTMQMRFQLAATAHQYAMTGGAADKAALEKEALDMYTLLLNEGAGSAEGSYAFSAASELIMVAQDSAAARTLLAPLVADATPYTDLTLLLAADLARAFQRNDDAMAMYAGALAKNPNIRDANYFLAYMYYEAKLPEKMLPLTDKLLEIDPSNGDNFLMRAYAYQLMAAAETDVKKKAELVKQQDALAAKENAMAQQHKVVVTRFERRAEGAALEGSIENFTKAAKSYSLTVNFLDLAGAVVETMTADVANVKAGERGKFALTPSKPGIVAYKYDALP